VICVHCVLEKNAILETKFLPVDNLYSDGILACIWQYCPTNQ